MLDQHLSPDCQAGQAGYCQDRNCGSRAKQAPDGRWFLTMGHAGFNTPANNGKGYASKGRALAAHRKCAGY